MNNILTLINTGLIDYDSLLERGIFSMTSDEEKRFGIIVHIRGREQFIHPCIDSFRQTGRTDFFVTIVEHSDNSVLGDSCNRDGINYIHVPANGGMFNKSLASNIGYIKSPKADYYIFHDIDCLVQRPFFDNIDKLIGSGAEAIHTFRQNLLLYCEPELTKRLIQGITGINEINIHSKGVVYHEGWRGAMGGSVLTSRSLFFKIGGYDPEIFKEWGPEDQFFWHKIQTYTPVIKADENELFHLYHFPSVNYSANVKNLVKMVNFFNVLPKEEKKQIIEYKSKILSKYVNV